MSERLLIVNADDLGQSPGINAGIRRAFEDGIVTSASLMVRWPAAPAAASYARAHPDLSLGLHVDLGEWTFGEEGWRPRYLVVDAEDRSAVRREVTRQLDRFRELMDADPTHIDGHQHVQRAGYPAEILEDLARRLGVTLRDRSERVAYAGAFYGRTASAAYPEGITVDRLLGILAGLPPGVTEMGCHPGIGTDVRSDYRSEREAELQTLCDPRVKAFLKQAGIRLVSHRWRAPTEPATV